MTWWRDRGLARGVGTALCAAAVWMAARAAAPEPAPAPTGAVSSVSSAAPIASTNAPARDAWADLADTWRRQPDADASPVENLTLPIEHYDNGRVRAVLRAGRAALGRSGMIWSWQVVVDLFDPDGRPDGSVEAANCLYDRGNRRGYCPGDVRLVRTNATVSGVGLYWSMADERMRILSEPVVRLSRPLRPAGLEGIQP